MPTMHPAHDSEYKLLFSHPEMMRDLLVGFVPGDWAQAAQFNTLERVNASYVSDTDRQRHDDMVWRLKVGPHWVWVYLLLEFQNQPDEWMAVRMMAYVSLLAQHLIREGQLDHGKLPALIPLVLYNGGRAWKGPTDVADCFAPSLPGLAPFRPQLRYHLIDETRLQLSATPGVRNVANALFQLERSNTPADIAHLAAAVGEALQAPEQQALRRIVNLWLRRLIRRKMPDIAAAELDQIEDLLKGPTMLEETLERLYTEAIEKGLAEGRSIGFSQGRVEGRSEGHAEGRTEGRTEGRIEGWSEGRSEGKSEGRAEGACQILTRLLEQRFGPLPDWAGQRLRAAPASQLERWADQLFTASSLEALLECQGPTG